MGGQDISADVTTITTNKTFGQPCGHFSVTTTVEHDWSALPGNTTVTIRLGADGASSLVTVMKGLLDDPSDERAMSNEGKPKDRHVLTGRDLGKLLVDHDITVDPVLAGSPDRATLARLSGGKLFGTAQEVLASLYQLQFKQLFNYRQQLLAGIVQNVTGPANLGDLGADIITDLQATEGKCADFSVLMENGSLWAAMVRNADSPWNELYTVTETDGRFVVRLRPTPFSDTGALQGVTVADISASEVTSERLVASDHERVNFVAVLPMVNIYSDSVLRLLGAGLTDGVSVGQNGFKPMWLNTKFCVESQQADIRKKQTKAWNWFRRNHEYKSGTLRIKGRTDIVVGTGARYAGLTHYVEGVQHQYANGAPMVTVLTLTRGQKQ